MNRDLVTLLWLGSEAWLAGPDGRPGRPLPVPAENPAIALASRLAEEFPGAGAVRILYQPAALAIEMIPAAEPPGRRPELRRRGCAWSAEGPAGAEELLLASEPHSPLLELARHLEEQGLRVQGAWTVATALEAMPRGPEEGPACLRLVIAGGWALLAAADALGRRRLRLHSLENAEEMAAEVRGVLATFDEQRRAPAWAVLEDEAWPPEIREMVRRLIPAEVPLAALLAQARRLPAGALSDFLRPAPVRLRRPLALAAVGVLSFAAVLACWRAHESAAERRRLRVFQEAASAAAQDAHLASARKLEEITHALEAALPPRYRVDRLLLALSRATPPEICLREIACQGPSFLVRGKVLGLGGVAGDPLGKLRLDLSAEPAAWSWTETPPAADGEFLWRGNFREAAEPPIRTPEEGSVRLAQALGQLPSRGKAGEAIAFLTRNWTAIADDARTATGRRSYRFSPVSRRLAIWSDLVAIVRALAAEPGVTLTGLELKADEREADAFGEVRLDVGVRWRDDRDGPEPSAQALP